MNSAPHQPTFSGPPPDFPASFSHMPPDDLRSLSCSLSTCPTEQTCKRTTWISVGGMNNRGSFAHWLTRCCSCSFQCGRSHLGTAALQLMSDGQRTIWLSPFWRTSCLLLVEMWTRPAGPSHSEFLTFEVFRSSLSEVPILVHGLGLDFRNDLRSCLLYQIVNGA